MTSSHAAERQTTERWSALGGVLLSALYLWVLLWLLLAVVVPSVGFGWQPVVITSGSMQPLIRPGDVVLSGAVEDVEAGQVITYEDPARPGTLTTHRVLSVTEDGALRTQGDANATPDSTLVPRDNVLGRGRLLVPLIGLPLLWLSGGAVLFGGWLAVTAISVAVVVGAGGTPAPVARRSRLRDLRPRAVQRAVVAALARRWQRLHDRVYRRHRPNPSRWRRALPGTAVALATAGLARTPATLAIGVLLLVGVLLLDPDGPQFRIGRWERAAARTADAAADVVAAGSGRALVALVLLVAVGGSLAGRSAAVFSAASSTAGNAFTAAATFPFDGLTLWLQNDPEGQDTVDRTQLAMSSDEPTQTVLFNYDVNDDPDPGLRIQNGATDPYDTEDKKVQRWVHTPAVDLTIASAEVTFHAAMKDFAQGKDATVTWYLRHCEAGGLACVDLGSGSVASLDWQAGTTDFVEGTIVLPAIANVVPAGRELELVATVPVGSDMWFAYDTVDHPSRLELTLGTPGTCPGPGTWSRVVTGDTRVEEDDADANFAAANELDLRTESGKRARTLLTLALPVIPEGCTMSSATLHLTTATSDLGRTILAQRLDGPLDTTTVTWTTQPSASGALGSGPSTANGPTTVDVFAPVLELYDLGNTGLVLRDAGEGDTTNSENRFRSSESRPEPDPEGPRLEITWAP